MIRWLGSRVRAAAASVTQAGAGERVSRLGLRLGVGPNDPSRRHKTDAQAGPGTGLPDPPASSPGFVLRTSGILLHRNSMRLHHDIMPEM